MVTTHNLGFPRIGLNREMKKSVEAYWRGEINHSQLEQHGKEIRAKNWQLQANAGMDWIPAGDFSWYDHVLEMSLLFGIIPPRFQRKDNTIDQDTFFCMARGSAPNGAQAHPCEMTKWFNTNYHYIVPEFQAEQDFFLACDQLFQQVLEAKQHGQVKPVILGPISLLWLGKVKDADFDKLTLLPKLIKVYQEVLEKLQRRSNQWVQIDEPILVLDLPAEWKVAFRQCYQKLNFSGINCLLATYFGSIEDKLDIICDLPVQGLHIDFCSAPEQIEKVINQLPKDKIVSLGVVSGRNIWRADLTSILDKLEPIYKRLGDRLWLAPSCSLLHVPVDLDAEKSFDQETRSWFAFAKQKLDEVKLLAKALANGRDSVAAELKQNQAAAASRRTSTRIHNPAVKQRVKAATKADSQRNQPFAERAKIQRQHLALPEFPTTTIGSFPQTNELRSARAALRKGQITQADYDKTIREEIALVVKEQEQLDIDVLVHGEPERNDMVEYFGEQLTGFTTSDNGWVQSYGSRCVKPPIIFGDVSRPKPMTVEWSRYAQSLTKRPMKGMLTGPVTILSWSFVRDDQPRSETAMQVAFALRDEVKDLETAGIHVIQIDEPAFREYMPLCRRDWQAYFDWAVDSFRISASGVSDKTQIHTHMCYSEFNAIMDVIAALDADVITLESSRSDMELLEAFKSFSYPNDIGPGVYDIHSPRIPSAKEMEDLLNKALQYIPIERLWVNPDCGLKTRGWKEVKIALTNMVQAAKALRQSCKGKSKHEVTAN